MSAELLTDPRYEAPGSQGHYWDLHMRAADIKLVQAGWGSACSSGRLLSNSSAGQTHSAGHCLPLAALWWFKGHTRMPDGEIWQRRCQVPEILITKADNASVLSLCEISGCASRKKLNKSYSFMSHLDGRLMWDKTIWPGDFVHVASGFYWYVRERLNKPHI